MGKFHVDDKIKVTFISPFFAFLFEGELRCLCNNWEEITRCLLTFSGETGRIWNIAARMFDEFFVYSMMVENENEYLKVYRRITISVEIKSEF